MMQGRRLQWQSWRCLSVFLAKALGRLCSTRKASLIASLIHFDGHGDRNRLAIGNSICRTKRPILFQSIGVLIFGDNTHSSGPTPEALPRPPLPKSLALG
jgi:hypothetical protein